MTHADDDAVTSAKTALRRRLSAARDAKDVTERTTAAADLASWISAEVPFRLEADVTVCCYASVGSEPGTGPMLDALVDRGVRVLLPITPPGPPTELQWARYLSRDDLERGRFGLPEPRGRHLSPAALATAAVTLVPALAVDRHGVRLGRGAGYYDRSLATTTTQMVAVVYDDELLDEVPGNSLDVRVGWALTPGDGFIPLSPSAPQ